jgi:exodeoxyribonuclease VII small subunit
MKFEEAMSRLEEIVKKLEGGDVPLDESLVLFEEGVKLSTFCTEKLNEAERKVEILIKDSEGKFETRSFKAE